MTYFMPESETAGKIKKFLISLFTAWVLLLQSVFFHGSLNSRHGKGKLLNVSHIFGTSLKKKLFLYVIVDFIYLFLFSFTFSVITFPAPSGYVFPFRKDSIMPHYSCCSLSTLSNSVLYPLLSCFEKSILQKMRVTNSALLVVAAYLCSCDTWILQTNMTHEHEFFFIFFHGLSCLWSNN